VKLEHDAYAKTITIIDTGVGITKGSEVKNQTTSQSSHPASTIAWVA